MAEDLGRGCSRVRNARTVSAACYKRCVEKVVSRHIRETGDGWIDARKRKPKVKSNFDYVIVQTTWGEVTAARYSEYGFHSAAGTDITKSVLYWQPFPNPRKAKARKR